MKKTWITVTAVLTAVLVLLFAAVLILIRQEQSDNEEDQSGTQTDDGTSEEKEPGVLDHPAVFSNIGVGDMTALTLNGARYTLKNGVWSWDEQTDMPLDHERLTAIAEQLTHLQSDRLVAQATPDAYAQGFPEEETHTVVLEGVNDQEIVYTIGAYEDGWGGGYYFSSTLIGDVYFLDDAALDLSYFEMGPYDFIVLDGVLTALPEDMQEVVLKDQDGNVVGRNEQINEWREQWMFLLGMDISPSAVQAYRPTAAQLTEWGFDDPTVVELTYLQDGEVKLFSCQLGHIKRGTLGSSEYDYVYVRLDQIVYLVGVGEDASFLKPAQ